MGRGEKCEAVICNLPVSQREEESLMSVMLAPGLKVTSTVTYLRQTLRKNRLNYALRRKEGGNIIG
jgi:hypothetical protein